MEIKSPWVLLSEKLSPFLSQIHQLILHQSTLRDLLERAGLKSLADSYKKEVKRKAGELKVQPFPAVPKILGQVQRYAKLFDVR